MPRGFQNPSNVHIRFYSLGDPYGSQFEAEAGISRLWGGIHVSIDDLTGRSLGAMCGREAWALARQYFDGSIVRAPIMLALNPAAGSSCQLRFYSCRGFFYKIQSAPTPDGQFVDDSAGFAQALDNVFIRDFVLNGTYGFYRVVCSIQP